MQKKGETSKQYFNTLSLIHIALLLGQLAFAVVVYVMHADKSPEETTQDPGVYRILVPSLAVFGFIASTFLPEARLKSLRGSKDLGYKLAGYRTMLIIKYALLEAPSLFALVIYLLTADYLFLGVASALIIFFIINRPSKDKLMSSLELDHVEKAALNDPNAVVTNMVRTV
ncbi:MAG TPA: hypothetical protein VL947_09450 [Cytophagales bacterium]|nr:hypothetical protein [Cytophagales bacterium]